MLAVLARPNFRDFTKLRPSEVTLSIFLIVYSLLIIAAVYEGREPVRERHVAVLFIPSCLLAIPLLERAWFRASQHRLPVRAMAYIAVAVVSFHMMIPLWFTSEEFVNPRSRWYSDEMWPEFAQYLSNDPFGDKTVISNEWPLVTYLIDDLGQRVRGTHELNKLLTRIEEPGTAYFVHMEGIRRQKHGWFTPEDIDELESRGVLTKVFESKNVTVYREVP